MPETTAAPIDPGLLASVVDPTLEGARTPPAGAYVREDVFEWERRHFFEGSWFCVGRSEDVASAGDQRSASEARPPARSRRWGSAARLLQRVPASRPRAPEVRHVAQPGRHQLPISRVGVRARRRARGRTAVQRRSRLDRGEYPLIGVSVADWMGWIVVNVDGRAPEFSDFIGDLGELVGPWKPARTFLGARHDYVVRANWKTIVENAQECFTAPAPAPPCARSRPSTAASSSSTPAPSNSASWS
jgi:glycine betaine catabolism A